MAKKKQLTESQIKTFADKKLTKARLEKETISSLKQIADYFAIKYVPTVSKQNLIRIIREGHKNAGKPRVFLSDEEVIQAFNDYVQDEGYCSKFVGMGISEEIEVVEVDKKEKAIKKKTMQPVNRVARTLITVEGFCLYLYNNGYKKGLGTTFFYETVQFKYPVAFAYVKTYIFVHCTTGASQEDIKDTIYKFVAINKMDMTERVINEVQSRDISINIKSKSDSEKK